MKPKFLILIAFVIWILENCYFGWNSHPSCTAERIWDYISFMTGFTGGWYYLIDSIATKVIKKLKESEK